MNTQWLPGIIVLGLGLLAGAVYVLLSRKKATPASPPAATELKAQDVDLRAQQLIEELKELEANKHQLDPAHYQAERTRLEKLAADAFRARDQARAEPAKADVPPARPRPAPTGFFARHPELKGAAWGAGLVVFFGALGAFLFLDEKDRGENDSMTGGPPAMGASGPRQPSGASAGDAEFQQALEQARKAPNDTQLVAAVVHELLRRQQFDEAAALNERALSFDPFHVENRIHRAVLHAARGDAKRAVTELRHLADTYPDAQEALLFAGAISMEHQDRATALSVFEQYVAESPADEVPPQLGQLLAELRRSPHP